jgi:hypothetical protein
MVHRTGQDRVVGPSARFSLQGARGGVVTAETDGAAAHRPLPRTGRRRTLRRDGDRGGVRARRGVRVLPTIVPPPPR